MTMLMRMGMIMSGQAQRLTPARIVLGNRHEFPPLQLAVKNYNIYLRCQAAKGIFMMKLLCNTDLIL